MRTVSEDLETGAVMIDGAAIDGFVSDTPCVVCRTQLVYFDHYDALFCPQCNEWKEGRCRGATCTYCNGRPARPLSGDS
jgi:hypothetical protein